MYRSVYRSCIFAVCLFGTIYAAEGTAAEKQPVENEVVLESVAAAVQFPPGNKRVEIVEDQEAGVIRFMIEGREKAILDAAGLHVREDIYFGRQIIDIGEDGFDEHVRKGGVDAP